MKLRQSFLLFFMTVSAFAGAQTVVRKAYPAPKVTPEVRQIRSTMRQMRVEAGPLTTPGTSIFRP